MRHRFRRPQQAPEEVRELARRVARPVSRGLVMYATFAAGKIKAGVVTPYCNIKQMPRHF